MLDIEIVEDEEEEDDIDEVNELFSGINLSTLSATSGRPRHLPPTTPGILMIPPVPYDIPEQSRRCVNLEFLLPYGVTQDMMRFSIIHQGWTGLVRLEWPDFFSQETHVLNQDGVQAGEPMQTPQRQSDHRPARRRV